MMVEYSPEAQAAARELREQILADIEAGRYKSGVTPVPEPAAAPRNATNLAHRIVRAIGRFFCSR